MSDIEICEVGPRDGLQGLPDFVPTACDLGIHNNSKAGRALAARRREGSN